MNRSMILSIVVLCLIFGPNLLSAQIGINTQNPHSSAILDVQSQDKGILFPRMSTIEREAINLPSDGLMVYDTDLHAFFLHIAGQWVLQKADTDVPSRTFTIVNFPVRNTPTNGDNTNEATNLKYAVVNVPPQSIAYDSGNNLVTLSGNDLVFNQTGTYLVKVSGRFYKNPENGGNMKVRMLLLKSGVNQMNTFFHLPNAISASATKTNIIVLSMTAGDNLTLQIKKDIFNATFNSLNLYGTFEDMLVEIEKLP